MSLALTVHLPHVSTEQKRRDMHLTIPNMITILRFLLVPVVVLAMLDMRWDWAFAGFRRCRHFRWRRRLHRPPLQPAFAASAPISIRWPTSCCWSRVFVVMGFIGQLPLWLVVTVVSRDALIVCAVLSVDRHGQPCRDEAADGVEGQHRHPDRAGGGGAGRTCLCRPTSARCRPALIILSGLLTVASAAAYLVAWLRHMSGYGEGSTPGT